jgi:hypothetical protein
MVKLIDMIDARELDEAIQAFGRATTETPIPRPERLKAEDQVRDFLLALRKRFAFTNNDHQ